MIPGVTALPEGEAGEEPESPASPRVLRQSNSFKANEETCEWVRPRQAALKVITSRFFEAYIGAVICFNVVVIIFETDSAAECRRQDSQCNVAWVRVANIALLVVYTLESAARLYVYRKLITKRGWDMCDLIIVSLSYVDLLLEYVETDSIPGVQMLRIFRVAKMLRAARLLRVFPELNLMLRGFLSAMSAMVWGFLMIMVLTLLWAIMAVEFLQPLALEAFDEGTRCANSFNGVFRNVLMLFQTLVAGDNWGECAVPIIELAPYSAAFFSLSLIMIQMGLTNLILAVVVEKAAEAHSRDIDNKQRQLAKERKKAEQRLTELCQDMDSDGDKGISFEELMTFFESSEELRGIFTTLEIQKEDIRTLFLMMDKDGSGDLTYRELVNCIHRADSKDLKRQMMVVKLQIQDIWIRTQQLIHSSSESMQCLLHSSTESMQQDLAVLASDVGLLLANAGISELTRHTNTVAQGAQMMSKVARNGKTQIQVASRERVLNADTNQLYSRMDEHPFGDRWIIGEAIDAEMNRIRSQLDQDLAHLAQNLQKQECNIRQDVGNFKVPKTLGAMHGEADLGGDSARRLDAGVLSDEGLCL